MKVSKDTVNLIIIFLMVSVIAVGCAFLFQKLRVDPVEENLKNDQVIKVLFVIRNNEGAAVSTNIFIYYPQTHKGAIFDVLGNTGAIWQSLGRVDRIDSIYKNKGIAVYNKEISELTDLDIPFTVEINEDDFGIIADLIGGLKVFISSPVDEVSSGGKRWLLPSGAVNLDGDKIRDFLDYQLNDEEESDKEERRQSAFIAFLVSMKDNRDKILGKKNFPLFSKCMKANIEDDDFYKLMSLITDLDTDSLTVQSVIGSARVVDGQTLLFPYQNGQLIKDVVKQKIRMLISTDSKSNRRVYVLEIMNGTSRQGLARNASILLQNAGYELLQVGNAERDDYEHTVIINHIGNQEAAKALGDFITCYNIIDEDIATDDEVDLNVDFTLILGDDWDGRYVRGVFGKEDKKNTVTVSE